MGRSRALALGAAMAVVIAMPSCTHGDDDSPRPTASSSSTGPAAATTPAGAPVPYRTKAFVPGLSVDAPSWLPPQPSSDEEHFLTWTGEGADVDRAVRFTSPVGLYDPGHHPQRLSPLPKDYVAYLVSLAKYGADISDQVEIDVDGHPATLVTVSTEDGMDGSLGCKAADLPPGECFGIQEFAVLRLAVIDVDGTIVLAWARVVPGAPYLGQDFEAFEQLLKTVRFA